MKIEITIDEAEVINDALDLLQTEIERYENDELVAPFIREGFRILDVIQEVKNKITESMVDKND
jgi:hypothetical protein